MATFGEVVYMCMDFLKQSSGDSFYTEEHVLSLIKNMRAFLIEKKYKGSRNSPFQQVSEENKQRIKFKLQPADISGCSTGTWLRSEVAIPELMDLPGTTMCTVNDLLFTNVSFIPRERMPYVGYNKWLKDIIYASRSIDGYLYLSSSNPQFMFLGCAGLTGVFPDPDAAIKANAAFDGNESCLDIMDEVFPLEEALISPCIESAVQELNGARFAPQDRKNNASDDLPDSVSIKSSPVGPGQRVEGRTEQ